MKARSPERLEDEVTALSPAGVVQCNSKVYSYWFYHCHLCALVLSGDTAVLPGWKGGLTLKDSDLWTPCGLKLQALQAWGRGGARDKGTGPGGTFPLTRGQGLLLSVGTEQQQNGEPRGNVTTDASCTWMTSVKSQAASPAVPLPRLFLAKHPLLLSRQQLTSRGR